MESVCNKATENGAGGSLLLHVTGKGFSGQCYQHSNMKHNHALQYDQCLITIVVPRYIVQDHVQFVKIQYFVFPLLVLSIGD